MLSDYTDEFCKGYILLCIIFWGFAGYAYRVNARRPAEDTMKREFRPGAIFWAPVTWPLFLIGFGSLFVLKAILYCVFLVLLAIALIVIRKPFIFVWLDKLATKVGTILLEANTRLIKMFLDPWIDPRPS